MKNYKIIRTSCSSTGAEYSARDLGTCSAMRAAAIIGRCEGGETITVYTPSGRPVSRVVWSPANGGKYIRVTI